MQGRLALRYLPHGGACCEAAASRWRELPTSLLLWYNIDALQMWNGTGWERFTLKHLGYVYNMGHEGRACKHPREVVSSLLVINMRGVNPISVRYCNCGKFSDGERGRWEQIRYTGWHASLLDSPWICSTFATRTKYGRLNES